MCARPQAVTSVARLLTSDINKKPALCLQALRCTKSVIFHLTRELVRKIRRSLYLKNGQAWNLIFKSGSKIKLSLVP